MKRALLIVGLFALWSTQADAATWIRGSKYPDGCREYTLTTPDTSGEWGVRCPSMDSNPQNKYWSGRKVEKLPGHASIVEVAPEPKFQDPDQCLEASRRMSLTSGAIFEWFRIAKFGTPDERVLTGPVADEVGQRLRTYMMRAIETGQNKYRFGTRYEDRDGICADYIEASRQEVIRNFKVVKAAAAKGNRDLIGTGMNPRPSKFNR